MAVRYSIEASSALTGGQAGKTPGDIVGARLKRARASINLATVGAMTTADWISLLKLPQGARFAFGVLTSTVTLATSTIAIGNTIVHGTNTKYRAAAVSTAVNAPALFGDASTIAGAALTAEEEVFLTVGVATLPAVGIVVVDIFFSAPS